MADDDNLREEYIDYSGTQPRYSNLNDDDKELFRQLSFLRYKHDRDYINDDRFYSAIDRTDLIGFLTDDELEEVSARRKHPEEIERKRKLDEATKYQKRMHRRMELKETLSS